MKRFLRAALLFWILVSFAKSNATFAAQNDWATNRKVAATSIPSSAGVISLTVYLHQKAQEILNNSELIKARLEPNNQTWADEMAFNVRGFKDATMIACIFSCLANVCLFVPYFENYERFFFASICCCIAINLLADIACESNIRESTHELRMDPAINSELAAILGNVTTQSNHLCNAAWLETTVYPIAAFCVTLVAKALEKIPRSNRGFEENTESLIISTQR